MSRILMASLPVTGHVLPGLPVARKLVERGHEVRWYTGKKFRARVEATGARFEPFRTAVEFDDSDLDVAFPGRTGVTGIQRAKFDFLHLFMQPLASHYHDLTEILREFPAEVLFADGAMWSAPCVTEKGGPPHALYCATCLGIKSRDTGPFGMGSLPSQSPIGRLRNALFRYLSANVLFGEVSAELSRQRASLGLAPLKFDSVQISPYLVLEATVPSFEYPLSDMPPQVHFVGALLADAPADVALPSWWGEVIAKPRPVVLLTQGTFATNPQELIVPAIQGLARDDLTLIVAGVDSVEALQLGTVPSNTRIERYIPFQLALPHVDVFVTNGGFGGVHYALANGVPLVVGGATEDKPEVANRVARTGAGVNLKTHRPSPHQIRDAVHAVLHTPAYRQQARRLQGELAQYDAPTESAVLLEQLIATQRPVIGHPREVRGVPLDVA